MNVYTVGSLIEFPVQFYDDTQPYGLPIDPTTVLFKYSVGGTETTLTYTGATVPSPSVIARLSVGGYMAQLNTVGMTTGQYVYGWVGQGVGQSIGTSQLQIVAASI